MRRVLDLDEGWAAGIRTLQDAVGELRHAIEHLGVMAVINGPAPGEAYFITTGAGRVYSSSLQL